MIPKRLVEWKEEVEENPEGMLFDIICKKCKSKETEIITNDNIGYSDCTGMWGDATVVIKCIDCGNAYTITVVD